MNGIKKNWFLVLMLAASIALINCGNDDEGGGGPLDPNDASTFVGTWDLVTLTAKTGDLFGTALPPGTSFTAGEPTNIQGIEITIDGTITLTATNYDLAFDVTVVIPGVGTQQVPETDNGTWSIDAANSQFTIDSADGDPLTGSFSISGRRLTIDTPDLTFVIEKR